MIEAQFLIIINTAVKVGKTSVKSWNHLNGVG